VAPTILVRLHSVTGKQSVEAWLVSIAHRSQQLWELDGEVMGRTRQLVVAIAAGELIIRVPAAARSAAVGAARFQTLRHLASHRP